MVNRDANPGDGGVASRPTEIMRRDVRGACPERCEGLATGIMRPVCPGRGSLS